jgi:hypothetical protein
MFQFFIAAMNQLWQDLPKHVAHAGMDYINERRREGAAEAPDSVAAEFLRAINDEENAKALARCTPELQKSVVKLGVAPHFAVIRGCLTGMTGFEHVPLQFNVLKTSCEMTGTIHYGAQSRSYHMTLVRTLEEDFWHQWKISHCSFGPASPAPAVTGSLDAIKRTLAQVTSATPPAPKAAGPKPAKAKVKSNQKAKSSAKKSSVRKTEAKTKQPGRA